MRQTRIICISFLICAALAVVAFWSGFYFGENRTESEQILTASQEPVTNSDKKSLQIETTKDLQNRDASMSKTEEAEEKTVESMKGISATKGYYIKDDGEYLVVYDNDTDGVYFETDLKLSDLPVALQDEAQDGICFNNVEELYDFLENYSS